MRVTKTENGERWLDIFEPLHDVLSAYLPQLEGDILFPSISGGYLSDSAYRRFYESIIKELNRILGGKWHLSETRAVIWDNNKVQGLTPHIFRHNFATMLYYSGVDLKEAARIMGHADEKMILDIYAHLDKQKSKSKEKLNSYLSANVLT